MPNNELKFSVVENPDELKTVYRTKRREWAQDVLKIAKEHPNVWLKLDEPLNVRYGYVYLRDVGLQVRSRNVDQKTSVGTVYFMWEELI